MMTACGTSRANTLHDYLVNGKADSLREAINLFEEEQHRMRVEENQNRMENRKGDNSYEKNGNAFNFDFRCNIYRMRQ